MATTAAGKSQPQLSSQALKPWGQRRRLLFPYGSLKDEIAGGGGGGGGGGRRLDSSLLSDEVAGGGSRRLAAGSLPSDKPNGIAGGGSRRPAASLPSDRRRSPPAEEGVGELEELRERLLGHLREAADRMNLVRPEVLEPSPSAGRPWNLRARRALATAGCVRPRRSRSRSPPAVAARGPERTVRLRSEGAAGRRKEEERRRFSVELTREEIEDDVFALTGSRPRRRPKKRPKSVQSQLDSVFPGLWLTEITAESYRVE